jgi:tetratricopeptide (TPR) repeat protein
MDSEHRHELKENELAEFFRHFGQFWEKWGNSLLLVILVVLVAVVSVQIVTGHRFRQHEQNWSSLEFETHPSALAQVAESVKHPPIRALAHLRAGDALLRGDVVDAPSGFTVEAQPLDAAGRQRQLQEAAEHYEAVRQMERADGLFRVNALLGLAAVAENQGQWDLAQQRYEQAIAEARDIHQPALGEHAAQRLAMLERLREPMTFAPPAAATETDAPQTDALQADTPPTDAPQVDPPQVDGGQAEDPDAP